MAYVYTEVSMYFVIAAEAKKEVSFDGTNVWCDLYEWGIHDCIYHCTDK